MKVAEVSDLLLKKGCYEVSLGDTIGVATPGAIATVLKTVLERIKPERLALHLHDTYGQECRINLISCRKVGSNS